MDGKFPLFLISVLVIWALAMGFTEAKEADAKDRPKPTLAQRVTALETTVGAMEKVLPEKFAQQDERWLTFLKGYRENREAQHSLNRKMTDRIVSLTLRLDQLDKEPQGDD